MTTTMSVGRVSARTWVPLLCWIAVVLDGYDAVVLGAVLPSLLDDPAIDVTPATATGIASAGLFGMMLGAMAMGFLTDRFGRRNLMMGSVLVFSVLTAACALADSATTLGILRFFAGVGLGGCLPIAIATVTEFSGRNRGANSVTLLMTGYHVGAVLTALLSIVVLAESGTNWRLMFILGALPALVLLPLMWALLPDSPQYLQARGRSEDARRIAEKYHLPLADPATQDQTDNAGKTNSFRTLFSPEFRWTIPLMWIGAFMGLLLVYGLNTWLPQIMRAADFDLGNALGLLMVLNIGAVIGLLFAGRIADAISPRRAAFFWFLGSALMLALLAVRLPVFGTYALVFITGVFVFSAQNLVNAFVATHHPAAIRGTALGMALGVGRLGAISGPIIGGTLVTAGIAYPWGFYAFAAVGLLGAAAMAVAGGVLKMQNANRQGGAPRTAAPATAESVDAALR
ncbi:aromatic acid/H+ symport family MFS transporter [Corynebacterium sp. YIM 101645]|uniref:Aromatic acid/H+ symport family MFS transporter n=1 Tax=Corynebacterium lemuris TaxID=1859292 RepID=A0ABT2FSL6_9CORY|nr:aromatic acid/H+ symport family MFS transporter [Corynebacterium lemuris]MCS5478208.1 aromatic acid/H+ symport family MFS transporter [Corynebacterium lemuris]